VSEYQPHPLSTVSSQEETSTQMAVSRELKRLAFDHPGPNIGSARGDGRSYYGLEKTGTNRSLTPNYQNGPYFISKLFYLAKTLEFPPWHHASQVLSGFMHARD
jgi:hypothetical protein